MSHIQVYKITTLQVHDSSLMLVNVLNIDEDRHCDFFQMPPSQGQQTDLDQNGYFYSNLKMCNRKDKCF